MTIQNLTNIPGYSDHFDVIRKTMIDIGLVTADTDHAQVTTIACDIISGKENVWNDLKFLEMCFDLAMSAIIRLGNSIITASEAVEKFNGLLSEKKSCWYLRSISSVGGGNQLIPTFNLVRNTMNAR